MIKILVLISLIAGLTAGPLTAAMVHYYDENGEVHYVNTDFAKVPDQYLDQVRPQLKAMAAEEAARQAAAAPPVTPTPAGQTPVQAKVKVIVLMSSYDRASKRMMAMLNSYDIPFRRYDAVRDPEGQRIYTQYNEPALPAMIINDATVLANPFLGNAKKALHDAGATHVPPY